MAVPNPKARERYGFDAGECSTSREAGMRVSRGIVGDGQEQGNEGEEIRHGSKRGHHLRILEGACQR